jgi:hypothetical protein
MAESETTVCNQALARIGAKRINDYTDATDTKPEAIYCRLFFDQTRRALLKDHYWPFAKARVALSRDTEWDTDTDNDFGHSYAYHLPNKFLRIIQFYNGSTHPTGKTSYSYEIEALRLLCSETAVYLQYVQDVTDVGAWDALFTEMMILTLANKLTIPLSQELNIKEDVDKELVYRMKKVRAMDRQEEKIIGRADLRPWNLAHYSDTA